MNEEGSIFSRYRSLVKLKILASDLSILLISECILMATNSLLRHECAFILGQLRGCKALITLVKVLETDPDPIVRHEAVEALGNMWNEEQNLICILQRFLIEDPSVVVRMSCELAIENIQFHKSNN